MSEENKVEQVAPADIPAVTETAPAAAEEVQKEEVAAEASPAEKLPPPPDEIPVTSEGEGNKTSDVLKALDAPAPKQPNKVAPKQAVSAGKPMPKKLTPDERKAMWAQKLREVGGYTNDEFVNLTVEYAMCHHGFNKAHKWGGVLITMVSKLSQRMRDNIPAFRPMDVDWLVKRLGEFANEKPLGRHVLEWNDQSKYDGNLAQRTAVRKFWGVAKKLQNLDDRERVISAFIDAAWPSIEDETRGRGGTFAERLHYLLYFVLTVCTAYDNHVDLMWRIMFHDKPSANYKQHMAEKTALRGGGSQKGPFIPKWVNKDNTCKSCGAPVIKDDDGHYVCTCSFCEHSIPVLESDAPSYRGQAGGGEQIPTPTNDRPPRKEKGRDHNGGKDRRHGRDEDELMRGKKKPHGKRFRVNDDDEDDDTGHVAQAPAEVRTVMHVGGEMPLNNPFGNLG